MNGSAWFTGCLMIPSQVQYFMGSSEEEDDYAPSDDDDDESVKDMF